MAANLSGASSLGCGLLSTPKKKKKLSPTPSSNIGSKMCIYRAQCAAALNRSSKCIPILITIMPQWHSSKLGLYSCRYEQRQPPPHPSVLEERNKRRRIETEEQTVNSRAVLVNYEGTSVIKHPTSSEAYSFLPKHSSLFSKLIGICSSQVLDVTT